MMKNTALNICYDARFSKDFISSAVTLLKMFLSGFFPSFRFVLGLHGQIWGAIRGFCENLLPAGAHVRQLQDETATGQG